MPGHRFVEVTDDWFVTDAPDADIPARHFESPDSPCYAWLTSGSTGVPKPVVTSVATLDEFVIENVLHSVDLCDRTALCMPGLGVRFGHAFAVAALAMGRTVCFATTADAALRMIELYAVDFALMSTEQMLMLTKIARLTGAQLGSLRRVRTGGTAITRTLLEAATTHLCREIVCDYGSSEAGLIARAHVGEVLEQPGLAGHVFPWLRVGIFDATGAPCPPDVPGVIRVQRLGHGSPTGRRAGAAPWIDLGDHGWMSPEGCSSSAAGLPTAAPRCARFRRPAEVEHAVWLDWRVADVAAIEVSTAAGAQSQIHVAVAGRVNGEQPPLPSALRAIGLADRVRIFDVPRIARGPSGKVDRPALRGQLQAAAIRISIG